MEKPEKGDGKAMEFKRHDLIERRSEYCLIGPDGEIRRDGRHGSARIFAGFSKDL